MLRDAKLAGHWGAGGMDDGELQTSRRFGYLVHVPCVVSIGIQSSW